MAEPSPNRSGVVAFVGEGVPAGVAQYRRVRLQFEGGNRRPLDHPGEARRRDGDPRLLTKAQTAGGGGRSFLGPGTIGRSRR
jgi:hypothetical protein